MRGKRSAQGGFTLLEVLVATVVMGIAVAGLLSGLSQSVRNAARLSEYDRAAMLARTTMNDLLLNFELPFGGTVAGQFKAEETGGLAAGWNAALRPFESQTDPAPGTTVLEEIECTVWWQPATGTRRTIQLTGYRRRQVPLTGEAGVMR